MGNILLMKPRSCSVCVCLYICKYKHTLEDERRSRMEQNQIGDSEVSLKWVEREEDDEEENKTALLSRYYERESLITNGYGFISLLSPISSRLLLRWDPLERTNELNWIEFKWASLSMRLKKSKSIIIGLFVRIKP